MRHLLCTRRCFLDNSIQGSDETIFILNQDGTELLNNSATLDGHFFPHYIRLLASKHIDLQLLINAELPDSTLNLANLSQLYKTVSLARILGLSISDYLSVRMLSGINPFEDTSAADLMSFVETLDRINSIPFTISELDYLLRHQESGNSPIAPSGETVETVF